MRFPGVGVTARWMGALALLVAALAGAVWGADRVQQATLEKLDLVRAEEERARLSLRLASAVRDQYIQQANTLLRGAPEDLAAYEEAHARADAEAAALRRVALPPDEQARLVSMLEASERLDAVYRHQVLPALEAEDWAKVRSEHARARAQVDAVVRAADGLQAAASARVEAARRGAVEVARRGRVWTTSLLGAALVLAAGVSLYVARAIARPLRGLAQEAEELGRSPSRGLGPSPRLARLRHAPGEVGALARALDEMARRLEQNREALVEAEKLAGLGRLAANVAHELNNPLGVLVGYVRLAKRRAAPELLDDLRVIDEEAGRCQRIVEELLGLARESQPGRREPLDLAEVARELVDRRADAALGGGDGIELGLEGPLPVTGDPDRLRQVLANLLRNAEEAAGPGGRVRVVGRAVDGEVHLSVEDTGKGIPDAARGRLFEPLFTTKPQGTGLGLAVSLAIARAHEGSLEAENRREGGARFTLRLPRRPQAGAREEGR